MKTVVALLKMGDRRFAKECGQGVMGFLIALPILLLLFRSLFIGAYLMGASLWLQHVNYELGICGLSNLKPAQCRHQARNKINRFLPVGRIRTLSVRRFSKSAHAQLLFIVNKHRIQKNITVRSP